MVSLGVVKENRFSVVITASHNPQVIMGINLGDPLLQDDINDIEIRIPEFNSVDYVSISIEDLVNSGRLMWI